MAVHHRACAAGCGRGTRLCVSQPGSLTYCLRQDPRQQRLFYQSKMLAPPSLALNVISLPGITPLICLRFWNSNPDQSEAACHTSLTATHTYSTRATHATLLTRGVHASSYRKRRKHNKPERTALVQTAKCPSPHRG